MGYESYLNKTLIWKTKPFFSIFHKGLLLLLLLMMLLKITLKFIQKSSHYCLDIGYFKPSILWLLFENRCDNGVCYQRTNVCVCPDRAKPASFSSYRQFLALFSSAWNSACFIGTAPWHCWEHAGACLPCPNEPSTVVPWATLPSSRLLPTSHRLPLSSSEAPGRATFAGSVKSLFYVSSHLPGSFLCSNYTVFIAWFDISKEKMQL